METRAYEIFSKLDRSVSIKVIAGHFATKHSHIDRCVDMTAIKSCMEEAKTAAKMLANQFTSVPVDTIISLDRMKMVGAFIADELAHTGINQRQNIAVISPEMTNDKMLMRDNFLPFIEGRHVLLLTASATTGLTVESAVDGVRYYGGTPVGVACVFGGRFDCSVPVAKIFGVEDIDEYSSYSPQDCPMCKANQKVDAVINSYGYSKII